MLEDYLYNEILQKLINLINDEDESEIVVDNSGYIYVDGEEGDYGLVKYYCHGSLLAIRTIYGGDEEDIDYTDYGKAYFNSKILDCLSKLI